MNLIWVGAGVLVLLIVAVDVFLTVFHASGRAGPIARRQNAVIWRLHRLTGRLFRSDRVLTFAAPVMVIATVVIWIFLLTAGFALIYYPVSDLFAVADGRPSSRWVQAFYYSGYTGATLGLGDVVPDSPVLRLLAPVQAFSGFALLSASLTYLLALYRELIATRALAQNISGYLDANEADALPSEGTSHFEAMARWIEGVTTRLLQADQASFQYPILHYFRPTDARWALSVQIARLYGVCRDPAVASHPSFRALRDAISTHAVEVDRRFVPGGSDSGNVETAKALSRMLHYMGFGDAPRG